MKTHVLKGTNSEIVQGLARISGDVREAIVFVDESEPPAPEAPAPEAEDIFAEMRPFMVDLQDMDDSREAIYTRMDGE
jgi:hypothetical protein